MSLRLSPIRLIYLALAVCVAGCATGGALTPLPYADDFSTTTSGWKTVNDPAVTVAYQDGALHFSVDELDQIAWSVSGRRFADFTLTVDATQVAGPNDNSYGVIVRYVDDRNFYRLDISGDGYYAINQRKDGAWIKLQDWTESPAIQPGAATNQLQVTARGPQFALLVNGQPVTTFTAEDFAQGDIGLTAGTLFDTPGVRIAFDNLTVTEAK